MPPLPAVLSLQPLQTPGTGAGITVITATGPRNRIGLPFDLRLSLRSALRRPWLRQASTVDLSGYDHGTAGQVEEGIPSSHGAKLLERNQALCDQAQSGLGGPIEPRVGHARGAKGRDAGDWLSLHEACSFTRPSSAPPSTNIDPLLSVVKRLIRPA